MLAGQTGAESDEFGDGRGRDYDHYDVVYDRDEDMLEEECFTPHSSRLVVSNDLEEDPSSGELDQGQLQQQFLEMGEQSFLAFLNSQCTDDDKSPGGCISALLDTNGQCRKGNQCMFKHDRETQQRTHEWLQRRLRKSVYTVKDGKQLSHIQGVGERQQSQHSG